MSQPSLIPADPAPPRLHFPFPLVLTWGGLSGFPSPAQDYEERALDLNEQLIKRPAVTFFMQVVGDSMEPFGIESSDILVVDRSIDPRPDHILVAVVDGEVTAICNAILRRRRGDH